MKALLLSFALAGGGTFLYLPAAYEHTANACSALEARAGDVAYAQTPLTRVVRDPVIEIADAAIGTALPRFVVSVSCAAGYWQTVLRPDFNLTLASAN
jgi:hypothetical protein